MKKLLALTLSLLCLVSLVGCTKGKSQSFEQAKKSVAHLEDMLESNESRLISTLSSGISQTKYSYSGFSISVKNVLNRCAPDAKGTYYRYGANKNTFLSQSDIEYLEGGEWKYEENLDNSYLIVYSGEIMQNPDLPYYKTTVDEIVVLLIVLDNSNNYVASFVSEYSSEFQTCAILLMF